MLLTNISPLHIKKGSSYDKDSDYKYILADSRSVFDPSETVFAAIRTDIGDGHRYIPELAAKGVKMFIVEEIPPYCYNIDATFIVVKNVPETLTRIAYSRIRGFQDLIVITGSIGKTVTKELIYNSLNSHRRVVRSPRSWNSRIGLPLAVCDMNVYEGVRRADMAIVEIGIDAPGQAELRMDCLPEEQMTGVVTPITCEHDSAFPSHRDKIIEKVKLLVRCRDIFYADSDPELAGLLREMTQSTLHPVTTGDHPSIYHALAAAVTEFMGFDAAGVDALPLVDKRREIYEGEFGNTIFHDQFTPDERSLREALDFFRRHSSPEKLHTLVLGDLLLPGDCNTVEHIRDIYMKAFSLARAFGVEKIYSMSAALSQISDNIDMPDYVEVCNPVMPFILSSYQNGTLMRDSQILLFGRRNGALAEFADVCMTAGHDTSLEVDLDALAHNFNYYRSLLPKSTRLVAMVKASAYGMGSVEIGKALQSLGAAYLAVAVIDEGVKLREAGIIMPIMVLNPITNRYPALFASHLEPAVFSLEELDRLIQEAERYGVTDYPVHVKLDTGMHRVGFLESHIDEIASRLASTRAVKVASAFSHLATADCLDKDEYTEKQLDRFESMTSRLRDLIGYDFARHILNTAGMMRFAQRAGKYELARLGIGLYGVSPLADRSQLKPVASFFTHIISLKHWPEGTPVGYGCKGMTRRDSIIATVPVGYADGINRRLSNGAVSFKVKGTDCPTIGNICMDLCMIDVTDVPDVKVGDKVEIFGPDAPVERIADILGTIPYEVLTWVSPRVKRVYIKK
ncbi:MAG: alanine racemase [Duncaniella sp.]|nr:alanine racemase [Duncaniella sp.]